MSKPEARFTAADLGLHTFLDPYSGDVSVQIFLINDTNSSK